LGQALTLLFAVLLLGGAPVADETGADDEPMVPTETDASVVETESNASPTQGNGSLAAGEADTADPNATATANASTSGEHLSAEAGAVEGDVEVKASPIEGTVRVSDRRVVEMTYTPPSAEEAMPEVPQTAPDDENVEETDAEAASTEDEQAGSSEAVWALAPATGLAAAAAVTQTTPVGRGLRRVLSTAPLAPRSRGSPATRCSTTRRGKRSTSCSRGRLGSVSRRSRTSWIWRARRPATTSASSRRPA
jgi:hypothetical protein